MSPGRISEINFTFPGGDRLPLISFWGILLLFLSLAGCVGEVALQAKSVALLSPEGNSGYFNFAERLIPQMENYSDSNGPVFTGAYAREIPAAADFVVVSYNLRYGEAITETIGAFQTVEPLDRADIILMQEMDEAGVDRIAQELGYNYVYYPASVARDGDNFGNAILARWPIREPAKLLLPGTHPLTGQRRTATRAIVSVGDTPVRVYSTHIEVATAPPAMRTAQVAALLDDIPDGAGAVIVGGDFNTVTGHGVNALASQFATAALDHDSADLGPTFTRLGLRPAAADHIFSRGLASVSAGVMGEIEASDHFPVWARFIRP